MHHFMGTGRASGCSRAVPAVGTNVDRWGYWESGEGGFGFMIEDWRICNFFDGTYIPDYTDESQRYVICLFCFWYQEIRIEMLFTEMSHPQDWNC